jgi:hypothetical protein
MDPYKVGEILGYLLIFGWVPYVCFNTVAFFLPPRKMTKPDKRPKEDPLPPRTRRPKSVKKPDRKPKHSYPVVSSYDEKHQIINPVEFGT